jgi:hypothetical protein
LATDGYKTKGGAAGTSVRARAARQRDASTYAATSGPSSNPAAASPAVS